MCVCVCVFLLVCVCVCITVPVNVYKDNKRLHRFNGRNFSAGLPRSPVHKLFIIQSLESFLQITSFSGHFLSGVRVMRLLWSCITKLPFFSLDNVLYINSL